MIIIPMFQTTSSSFIERIELDEILFYLKIQWNSRAESFMLSISDQDNNLILAGVKLIPNYVLTSQFKYNAELPKGSLILIDLENDSTGKVTFDNLGVRYKLAYYTEEETNELQQNN